MTDDIQLFIDEARSQMSKSIERLEGELAKVRAGKANPSILNGILVDYFDNPTPLNQVANISTTDAKTIVVQPWEKGMLEPIEKAITASNIGLNPQNDGTLIRLIIPPLTEERRLQLVKDIKNLAEEARISIRNARREANDSIKKLSNDGVAEDQIKEGEGVTQTLTNEFTDKVEKYLKIKEEEIMTV